MIKLYAEGIELDFFEDEGIVLNRSVKNLQDISAVFSTFSQQFTLPASPTNNRVFQHYYRDDINASISSLKRLTAYITLNGKVFESGGLQIEGASIINGVARDYKVGFYGNTSKLKELAGGETLKALDLSSYDHFYEASTILPAFGATSTGATLGLFGGDIIYPLFSPVKNWYYDSGTDHGENNIAFHVDHGVNVHGVNYFEPKPAIKVTKILEAIEARYGLTFTGSFLTSSPFTELFLWLHNKEGYTFEGVDDTNNFSTITEPLFNVTHTKNVLNTKLDNVNNTMSFKVISPTLEIGFGIEFTTLTDDVFIDAYVNSSFVSRRKFTTTAVSQSFSFNNLAGGEDIKFRIVKTTASVTVALEYSATALLGFIQQGAATQPLFTGVQSNTTYTDSVVVSNLLPDQPIVEFLNGLIKMYNLIVTSEDGITFNFETYDSFYGAGDEVDLSRWLDTREVEVQEVPRYGALEFRYNESDQVLQKRYRAQNGRGYGDLVQRFNFDSEDTFSINVPFDLPFTEILTDRAAPSTFTAFSVYQSIDVDEQGEASSYYGSPVLFYHSENLDITTTPISWLDEVKAETRINLIPFCQTVNSTTASVAKDICFSEEVNPYLRTTADENLYSGYWSSFISNIYNNRTRLFKISAYINMGVYMKLKLNSIILWKGRKYIINNMSTDFKTGKTELELITKI